MTEYPTLYYKIKVDPTTLTGVYNVNTTSTDSNTYANSYSLRHMMNKDGTANEDLIYYEIRSFPPKNLPQGFSLESYLNENITIKTKNGSMIFASALYQTPQDPIHITRVDSVQFTITKATGDYVGATVMEIHYNNTGNYRRRIDIS